MPFSLSSLATEIHLLIADYLGSERSINALARTSRRFYQLLNDYLYRYNATKNGSSALLWAARRGQSASAAHSIAQGGNIQATWIVSPSFRPRYYIRVSTSGEAGIVDLLKQNECLSCTPIYAASLGGYVEVVDLLMRHGANTELHLGRWGCPLQAASQCGQLTIVRKLLVQCRDIDKPAPYKSRTALHITCLAGHDRVVQCLIEAGANVMAQDDELETPLHLALREGGGFPTGRLRTVQWLLVSGADRHARNRKRETPLNILTRTKGSDLRCLFSKGFRIAVYEADAEGNQGHKPTSLQRLWSAYIDKQTEAATESSRLRRLQAGAAVEAESARVKLQAQRQLDIRRRHAKDQEVARERARKAKEDKTKALQAQEAEQQAIETSLTQKQNAARKTWLDLRAKAESALEPPDAATNGRAASCFSTHAPATYLGSVGAKVVNSTE
ncbi:uncharacterized protein BP5553_10513 [Venustampulla echinocandica]|uniref:Uncharacterized protein n=1 Tax=Venustampulla echinocandica TaxID=2656787 RepID=A0A370T9I2_9HELO|nr:uncharacterized protein BP5553_10513 [Venustampulla echinocandica]RDL30235.1 hypothetical protein BP5553_10513 [Venustampulla echinocandica]